MIRLGTKKAVARTLVYLLNMKEGTMPAIELGTGLSKPEMSTALKYMEERGWVCVAAKQQDRMGRPRNIFSLGLTADEILKIIGNGKKAEIRNRISLMRKARALFA